MLFFTQTIMHGLPMWMLWRSSFTHLRGLSRAWKHWSRDELPGLYLCRRSIPNPHCLFQSSSPRRLLKTPLRSCHSSARNPQGPKPTGWLLRSNMVQISIVSLASSPITASSNTSSICPLCFSSRGQACWNTEIFLLPRALFLPEIHLDTPLISFKSLVGSHLLNEALSDVALNTFHLITWHTNTHMHTLTCSLLIPLTLFFSFFPWYLYFHKTM